MVYPTKRFVLRFASCYFVLAFFSPFIIAIITLEEERFAHVWFCLFHLPLGFWEGLRLVIVTLPVRDILALL